MFPVIWAAPPYAEPADPASWRLANKMLGITISEADVAAKWSDAKGSPALEARFRIQYLGQAVSDAEKWIDPTVFNTCTAPIDPEIVGGLPLFVGIDGSGGDDIFAVVRVWPTRDKYFVDSKFYLPHKTALKYQEKYSVPYEKWEKQGHIVLLDQDTISLAVQERIAADILADHAVNAVNAVCFDRAYVGEIVETLKAEGIERRPVGQGWGVSSGCDELDRRLKEASIQFAPNAVLRFCAENAEVKSDDRGNFWPIKPTHAVDMQGSNSQRSMVSLHW